MGRLIDRRMRSVAVGLFVVRMSAFVLHDVGTAIATSEAATSGGEQHGPILLTSGLCALAVALGGTLALFGSTRVRRNAIWRRPFLAQCRGHTARLPASTDLLLELCVMRA